MTRRVPLACLALLVALSAWPASASARTDRIVIAARPDDKTSSILELVDPVSGAAQPFAGTGSQPWLDHPTWSHDASGIAFSETSDSPSVNGRGVVLKSVADGAETLLLDSTALRPSFSRTSDELAYWLVTFPASTAQYTLKVRSSDGQSTRTLAGPYDAYPDMAPYGPQQPAWSPDGKWIAFASHLSIQQVSLVGEDGSTLVPSDGMYAAHSPAYSPDGKRLSYLKSFRNQNGVYFRWQLIVRSLEDGSEKVLADYTAPAGTSTVGPGAQHGPQSWSPDGKQIVYGDVRNVQPDTPGAFDATLHVVNADGTGDHTLLHRYYMDPPAWSLSPPQITIEAPAADARLTGRETVGAAEQQLRFRVESAEQLTGVCYAVQTDPLPVPDQQSCTNASGPTNAPSQHTADLRPLIDAGTIVDGENVIRVWAYDQNGARGSAEVKIVLARRNLYVKHVEVAQALSPPLGPLPANPLLAAPWPLAWTVPSLAGFPIPLIAGRSTLLRIYVGDANLESGKTDIAAIHYKVAAGATVEESDQAVAVTAADVAPAQTDPVASINVWLPGGTPSSPATLTAQVEVNAGEATPECRGCFPHGNQATMTGIAFEQGGTIDLRPVPILLIDGGNVVQPDPAYRRVWADLQPYLPVADSGVNVLPDAGSVVTSTAELTAAQTANPDFKFARCALLYTKVDVLRAVSAASPRERWIGMHSPPSYIGCNGISNVPGATIVLNVPAVETLAHELGHSLGLEHTLSLAGHPPDAQPLPYVGIGAHGYRNDGGIRVYNALTTSDLMGYHPNLRWTSPATWFRMHQGILGGVASSRSARATAASRRAGATAAPAVRRLVSGYISRGRGVIFSSLVAPAIPPASAGPVAGKVVALDRRGRVLASTSVTGNPIDEDGSGPVVPFVIALPPTATAASLALQAPNGKRMATLRRSRHRPRARFVRLPRRVSARRQLTVRWKATDADRDRLTVTLLARRGKAWHTIAIGPAAHAVPVRPSTLGHGAGLRLRLLVSDGLTTTRVDAKPVIVRG